MCVLCIIDRETVVAATKFVLCRTEWFKRYEEKLLEAYQANVWPLGADFEPHWCLVLSLDTGWPTSLEARSSAVSCYVSASISSKPNFCCIGAQVVGAATSLR